MLIERNVQRNSNLSTFPIDSQPLTDKDSKCLTDPSEMLINRITLLTNIPRSSTINTVRVKENQLSTLGGK